MSPVAMVTGMLCFDHQVYVHQIEDFIMFGMQYYVVYAMLSCRRSGFLSLKQDHCRSDTVVKVVIVTSLPSAGWVEWGRGECPVWDKLL